MSEAEKSYVGYWVLGTLLNFEPRESASITSPWPAVLRDEAG